MPCDDGHSGNEIPALKELPISQSGDGRHRCAVCAYLLGEDRTTIPWSGAHREAARAGPGTGPNAGRMIRHADLAVWYTSTMRNEFTAIIERDGDWFVAFCPEIPGANGQGRSKEEATQSLAEAIALVLDDRRADGLRGVPADAVRETVIVG